MILKDKALTFLVLSTVALALPAPAFAYIGPGAGIGAIAGTLALLLGLLFLVVGLVWFPLKRALKGRKETAETAVEAGPAQ